MGDGVLEVVHASTGCALKNNRALVQKLCLLVTRDVYGEEISVLGTESLDEMFARQVVSWSLVVDSTRDITTAATNRSLFLHVHLSRTSLLVRFELGRPVVRTRQSSALVTFGASQN